MPIVVVQAVTGLGAGAITFRFGWVRPLIGAGMALTTIGFGLFVSIGTTTSLVHMVIIEIVAALGVGSTFQAPLIAYQSAVDAADFAVATALFGFVRSLSTCVSVVVGGVIFQNSMSSQARNLQSVLGPQLARNFSASNATTNVLIIRTLPLQQQEVVKKAYVSCLKNMWIMYACVGALGLVAALFMRKRESAPARPESSAANATELVQVLSHSHPADEAIGAGATC